MNIAFLAVVVVGTFAENWPQMLFQGCVNRTDGHFSGTCEVKAGGELNHPKYRPLLHFAYTNMSGLLDCIYMPTVFALKRLVVWTQPANHTGYEMLFTTVESTCKREDVAKGTAKDCVPMRNKSLGVCHAEVDSFADAYHVVNLSCAESQSPLCIGADEKVFTFGGMDVED